ncbi:MAG: cytochrome c3 family protein [Opitutaceae bacterium]|nr:cytochrome c3 family protein [Opitutaceae bacterium]
MDDRQHTGGLRNQTWANLVLQGLVVLFGMLTVAFLLNLWGRQSPPHPIPPVDPAFLDTATVRRSYADLVRAQEDLSDFDCYTCHEKNKPPVLRYDANQNLLIPPEHADIVMGHGQHGRNNNCFNCHNETNLELLQPRDGRPLTFADSTPLCGSCHGPTYRDWEAGAHGRISGYWNRTLGSIKRQDCVNCHNPHSPKFPPRKPAPGPHLLHETEPVAAETAH